MANKKEPNNQKPFRRNVSKTPSPPPPPPPIPKCQGNNIKLPPLLVDRITRNSADTAAPSRVQKIVQQTERIASAAAQKNIVGNKKKAEMDMVQYLESLRWDSSQVCTCPEEPVSMTNVSTGGRVNFIKLNKVKLIIKQLEVAKKKEEERQKEKLKLKSFSKVQSKYMDDFERIVERNRIDEVTHKNDMYRATEMTENNEPIYNPVPSRYMECYRKIQMNNLMKKCDMQRKLEINGKNKPFRHRKNFVKENAIRVSHMRPMHRHQPPFVATKAKKKFLERGKVVKSRYMNFMEQKTNETKEQALKRKRDAMRELRKHVCAEGYSRNWEKKYKQQVAKWLRLRNRHPKKAEVKNENNMKKLPRTEPTKKGGIKKSEGYQAVRKEKKKPLKETSITKALATRDNMDTVQIRGSLENIEEKKNQPKTGDKTKEAPIKLKRQVHTTVTNIQNTRARKPLRKAAKNKKEKIMKKQKKDIKKKRKVNAALESGDFVTYFDIEDSQRRPTNHSLTSDSSSSNSFLNYTESELGLARLSASASSE